MLFDKRTHGVISKRCARRITIALVQIQQHRSTSGVVSEGLRGKTFVPLPIVLRVNVDRRSFNAMGQKLTHALSFHARATRSLFDLPLQKKEARITAPPAKRLPRGLLCFVSGGITSFCPPGYYPDR